MLITPALTVRLHPLAQTTNMNPEMNTITAAVGHDACLAARPDFVDALLSEALYSAIFIALSGLALCGIHFGVAYVRSVRRFRRDISKRRRVSTEEFLSAIGDEPRYDALYVAMREAFARMGKVPVEVIYPIDTFELFYMLTFNGFDTVEITMALDKSLDIWIPDNVAERVSFPTTPAEYANTTIVDCVKRMLESEALRSLLAEKEMAGQ
jgi:acyl carrier protein